MQLKGNNFALNWTTISILNVKRKGRDILSNASKHYLYIKETRKNYIFVPSLKKTLNHTVGLNLNFSNLVYLICDQYLGLATQNPMPKKLREMNGESA